MPLVRPVHIKCLELSVELKVLKHFAQLQTGKHIIIRTDNIRATACINRKVQKDKDTLNSKYNNSHCSLRSPAGISKEPSVVIAYKSAFHRSSLHSKLAESLILKKIWQKCRKAEVDLFAFEENTQCALWFTMNPLDFSPLGVEGFSH